MVLEGIESIIDQPTGAFAIPEGVDDAGHAAAESADARNVREARDAMQAFVFFSSAIATQMSEIHDKLAHVEVATSSSDFYARLAKVEAERDLGRLEVRSLRDEIATLQRDNAQMRSEIERQRITFADHHAAKQEISRLRAEVDRLQAESDRAREATATEPGRRWRLAR